MSKPRRLREILADLLTPGPNLELGPTMTVRRGRFPWSTTVYRDSRFDLRHECRDCQGAGTDPASVDHNEPDLPCATCGGTGVITLEPDTTSLGAPPRTDTYVSTTIATNGHFDLGGDAA
jgi:hypothetical protein